jgi:hypothetical protein
MLDWKQPYAKGDFRTDCARRLRQDICATIILAIPKGFATYKLDEWVNFLYYSDDCIRPETLELKPPKYPEKPDNCKPHAGVNFRDHLYAKLLQGRKVPVKNERSDCVSDE